jgi:hypothetical protein
MFELFRTIINRRLLPDILLRFYRSDFKWRYLPCPNSCRKEVTAMIKKITRALRRLRRPLVAEPRVFNEELMEQRREDVFVLMHQQISGLK